MNKIALIVGVSCSGKDHLLSGLTNVINYGISLSHIMDIQKLNQIIVSKQPIVVNTHIVISNNEDYVIHPKSDETLGPVLYVHISAPPKEILERRLANVRSRKELIETKDKIELHQNLSERITSEIAKHYSSTYVKIWNDNKNESRNIKKLTNILNKYIYDK